MIATAFAAGTFVFLASCGVAKVMRGWNGVK